MIDPAFHAMASLAMLEYSSASTDAQTVGIRCGHLIIMTTKLSLINLLMIIKLFSNDYSNYLLKTVTIYYSILNSYNKNDCYYDSNDN